MKKLMLFAATALVLAGCSQDEFVGNSFDGNQTEEITFSMETPNLTRVGGKDAAEKLENKFIVYGWKTTGSPATTSDVFKFYSVNWNGKAGQTESNTAGWEYVGYMSEPLPLSGESVEQSIKYWDYSASQYDFLAWSVLAGGAPLKEIITLTGTELQEGGVDVYNPKALHFEPENATALSKVYLADQKTVAKADYKKQVNLTFKSLATKVRLGIYETVPGYSVKDVKFYQDATPTKVDAPTLMGGTDKFITGAKVTVKYLTSDGTAVVKYADETNEDYATLGTFTEDEDPEYKESSSDKYLGRTSNTATLSKGATDDWFYAFPGDCGALTLKVDYTLVPRDGGEEVINVTGATATVPAQYANWKNNYAYTYLFKISDKTNGSTGDPTDPDPDPEGLYPITFDAVVLDVQDGSQETITTVSSPSFTTYQKGSNVTGENEYKAYSSDNHIWVSVYDPATSDNVELTTNIKLYTAYSLDDKLPVTEANVANYKNNAILLTDVTSSLTITNNIPATESADGTKVMFGTADPVVNKIAKFEPAAGKTYVVEYTKDTNKYYKVIKVTGSTTAPTYTIATYATGDGVAVLGGTSKTAITEINEGENFDVVITEGTAPVIGAEKFIVAPDFSFKADDTTNGLYKFTAKAGTEGSSTIELSTASGSINIIAYNFNTVVDLAAGSSPSSTATPNANDDALVLTLGTTNPVVASSAIKVYKGDAESTDLTLSAGSGSGKYDITVADNAAGDYRIVYANASSDVLAETTVTVLTYSITSSAKAINLGGVNAEKSVTLTSKLGTVAGAYVLKNTTPTIAALTGEDSGTHQATTSSEDATKGQITLTGTAVGDAIITTTGTSLTVPVYNFAAKLYTDAACATPATTINVDGTYYVKFTNNGTTEAAALTASSGTLTNVISTTGVYKYVAPNAAATDVTITFVYNGQTFTLAKFNVVTP